MVLFIAFELTLCELVLSHKNILNIDDSLMKKVKYKLFLDLWNICHLLKKKDIFKSCYIYLKTERSRQSKFTLLKVKSK